MSDLKPNSALRVLDLDWSHRRMVTTIQKVMSGIFPYNERRADQVLWSRLHSECNTRCQNDEVNILFTKMPNRSCHTTKQPYGRRWRTSKPFPYVHKSPLLPVQAPQLQPRPPSWRVPGVEVHSWERLLSCLVLSSPRRVPEWWIHSWARLLLPLPIFGGFLDACCIAGSTSPPFLPPVARSWARRRSWRRTKPTRPQLGPLRACKHV